MLIPGRLPQTGRNGSVGRDCSREVWWIGLGISKPYDRYGRCVFQFILCLALHGRERLELIARVDEGFCIGGSELRSECFWIILDQIWSGVRVRNEKSWSRMAKDGKCRTTTDDRLIRT